MEYEDVYICKDVYKEVKNYSDLLETNLMFFKGEINETFYYLAPCGKGEDQNDHAIVSTNNLIELTEKYRIFTVNGQSSYSDYCTKQRSYLCFYMEENVFEKIYNKLRNDPRIWVIFYGALENKDNEYDFYEIASIDTKLQIVLTLDCDEPYSIWKSKYCYRYEDELSYKSVNKILKGLIYCIIIRKDFCILPNADDVLIEHLR